MNITTYYEVSECGIEVMRSLVITRAGATDTLLVRLAGGLSAFPLIVIGGIVQFVERY
jgi:hypothetical protein